MRSCSCLFGLIFTLVGLASIWVLFQIGGKSDGPGAIVFYIGAAMGLFLGGIFMFFAVVPSGNAE